jgi:hypothetical protein
LDYRQESGRARRDGDASQAIMLIDGHRLGWEDPSIVDSRVQAYISGHCQWQVLDIYLDGTVDGYTRQQYKDSEVIYNWC